MSKNNDPVHSIFFLLDKEHAIIRDFMGNFVDFYHDAMYTLADELIYQLTLLGVSDLPTDKELVEYYEKKFLENNK